MVEHVEEKEEVFMRPRMTTADICVLFKQLSTDERAECINSLLEIQKAESTNESADAGDGSKAIEPSAGQPLHQDEPTLLGLPAEIRNEIYEYILIPQSARATIPSTDRSNIIDTAIFRTCNQLYHEASTLFYGKMTFAFDIKFHATSDPTIEPSPLDFSPVLKPLQLATRFSSMDVAITVSPNFPSDTGLLYLFSFLNLLEHAIHTGYSRDKRYCNVELALWWNGLEQEAPALQYMSPQDLAKALRRWNRAKTALDTVACLFHGGGAFANIETDFMGFWYDRGPLVPAENRFETVWFVEDVVAATVKYQTWDPEEERPQNAVEGTFGELAYV